MKLILLFNAADVSEPVLHKAIGAYGLARETVRSAFHGDIGGNESEILNYPTRLGRRSLDAVLEATHEVLIWNEMLFEIENDEKKVGLPLRIEEQVVHWRELGMNLRGSCISGWK